MSKKSKNSKPTDAWLHRPFEPDILARAEALADRYQVILQEEEGWFYGHGLEFPHAFGDGKTPAAAVKETRKAFTLAAATMLEQGQQPPIPAAEQTKPVQLNIRLNAEEKALITEKARAKGFRSVSDYIRSVAIG